MIFRKHACVSQTHAANADRQAKDGRPRQGQLSGALESGTTVSGDDLAGFQGVKEQVAMPCPSEGWQTARAGGEQQRYTAVVF